ncbi:MAG: ComEC/Rec2 family competence protein [Oscillospiraceae bacterium]|jgi:ComEC/Rec2-related protein|nr:ComEC/Rec2 family competence protein [Oscillospiraceae bacterium]
MARPFAVLGFSMLLALALLFFLPGWAAWALLGLGAAGLVAALCLRKRAKRTASAFACACAACALASALLLLQLWGSYAPALRLTGDNLQIRAQVVGLPEARYGRYYYQLKLLHINGVVQNAQVRFTGKVPLYAAPYDVIEYTGSIFALGEDAETRARYLAQGIYLGSYANGFAEDTVAVEHTDGHQPMRYILRLRERIERNLREAYSVEQCALFRGMLLGDKDGIDYQTRQDFTGAGVSHLFAVSGLHMSLLSWSVYRALLALRCPRTPAACLCAGFVLLFMALTGFSASCVRAGIMMLLLLAGECAARPPDALNSLGLAATVLMIASPLSAGQVGLQLSFGATLGILLFHKRLCAPVERRARKWPQALRKNVNRLWSGLCLSLSAMMLTLPVALLRLPGKVLWIAPLANLALVPLGSAAILVGGLFALTNLSFLRVLSEPLADALLWATKRLGNLRVPGFTGGHGIIAAAFACGLLLAAGALLLRYCGKPVRLRITASVLCLLTLIACWLPGYLRRSDARLRLLETGAGVSVLLSQGEHAALLGCGGDELPAAAVEQALTALGVRQLELLLLPGQGKALEAGAGQLLRDLPVSKALAAQPNPEAARYAQSYAEATATLSALPLWEGASGTFYNGAAGSACLLELHGVRVLVLFAYPEQLQDLPASWRNADYIISLQSARGELRVTPQGKASVTYD